MLERHRSVRHIDQPVRPRVFTFRFTTPWRRNGAVSRPGAGAELMRERFWEGSIPIIVVLIDRPGCSAATRGATVQRHATWHRAGFQRRARAWRGCRNRAHRDERDAGSHDRQRWRAMSSPQLKPGFYRITARSRLQERGHRGGEARRAAEPQRECDAGARAGHRGRDGHRSRRHRRDDELHGESDD